LVARAWRHTGIGPAGVIAIGVNGAPAWGGNATDASRPNRFRFRNPLSDVDVQTDPDR
jgi:hypothetical protein